MLIFGVFIFGVFIASLAWAQIQGDLDTDGDVDRDDLGILTAALGTDAASGDPRDLDHDGKITVLDARQLTLLCTRPRCAVEMGLELMINAPEADLVTAGDVIDVAGTVFGPVESVVVNGVGASLVPGSFTAVGIPLIEGTNRLVATAQGAGGETATASISVRRDTQAPLVVIESPRDGDFLVSPSVTIAGTVNDIIPGATVNEDDVTVTINGQVAEVMNRTFLLPDLALDLGANTLTATAVDRAGNSGTTTIEVRREPDLAGIRLQILGGNNQQGLIGTDLPQALEIEVTMEDGTPIAGRPLVFEVSRGDGLLGNPVDLERRVTLLSDSEGRARMDFQLGSRTGEGSHRVKVTTPGSLTFAEFCASAMPSAPETLSIARAVAKRAVAGQAMAEPLSVIVSDAGGNPVPGVPVIFRVELGGGAFGEDESVTVATDMDGIARASWTLGPSAGVDNNLATATFAGNPGFPASFRVGGLIAGEESETTVTGVVQDSSGQPIVGARAVIRDSVLEALTGADGRFTISGVSPGGHRVQIDGSAANDEDAGIYFPEIDFAVEVVSGAENTLDQIVVLPFLDMPGARQVGGDDDVILEMAGVPGFGIKVFANSVVLPDGSRGEIMMSSSQVKFDKLPMEPPQGGTPIVVGTLQPAGIRFDPPAQVIYPNVEGLAPGDVADIFAFHQDIGQFVNVGPGTVSEDGAVVVSDPGFGIVQSGWHCLIRLPGPSGDCANCFVEIAGPVKVCPGNTVIFTTPGVPAGGAFSWSGGGNPSSGSGASFSTSFSNSGPQTIQVNHTCPGEGGSAADSFPITVEDDGKSLAISTVTHEAPSKLLDKVGRAIEKFGGEARLAAAFKVGGSAKSKCCASGELDFTASLVVELEGGATLSVSSAPLPIPIGGIPLATARARVSGSVKLSATGQPGYDGCPDEFFGAGVGKLSATLSVSGVVSDVFELIVLEIGAKTGINGGVTIRAGGSKVTASGTVEHDGLVVFVKGTYNPVFGDPVEVEGNFKIFDPEKLGSWDHVIFDGGDEIRPAGL